MLMLSGFFLTKEPHIHTLVESWTWSWDCCGHGQTEWGTLYKKALRIDKEGLLISLWMCLIQVKPALGIGKLMSWGSEGVAAAGDATRLTWPRSGRGFSCSFWSGDEFDSNTCSGVSSISRYLPAPHSLDHQNTLADLRPDQGLNFLMLQQSKQFPCKILRPWWPCSSSLQFVDLFWPPLLLGASVSGASNEAVE